MTVEEIAKAYGYDPLKPSEVVNVLRDESKMWISKLTSDEIKAVSKYTYNGVDKDGLRLFEKINGALEGRYYPKNEKEEKILSEIISNIEQAILKNKLNHDIIVYRSDINPDSLEGTVKKFLSTSVTKNGVLGGHPNVAIIIPKGTNGAYVEAIAHDDFKKQREFLFNTNITLEKITNNGLDVFIVKEWKNDEIILQRKIWSL